jgi:poly-gamma-glutamate capsule biosynthesis protein CapA/YwtB (metallophosphatase superfamily)
MHAQLSGRALDEWTWPRAAALAMIVALVLLPPWSTSPSDSAPVVAAPQATHGVPPSPSPLPKPTPKARGFSVAASGDVLLHSGLWRQAQRDAGNAGGYDFGPLFAAVAPIVEAADLAICHLETPVGGGGGPFTGYPIFKVPPQVVPALRTTGYDACSTASNHSLDGGEAGIVRTLDALDAAGLAHTGTARNPQEQARPVLVTANGVRVGLLSCTFSFNGLVRPRGKEWLANALDPGAMIEAARLARLAGAEVVIVSVHWGAEYQHAPNGQQLAVAQQLLASPDIDLILGHHAHVVQPLERIGHKWVAYGMGNHVSNQDFSARTRDGLIPRFTFVESSPGRFAVSQVTVFATYMQLGNGPARVYPVTACPPSLATACAGSAERSLRVIGSRGAFAYGMATLG